MIFVTVGTHEQQFNRLVEYMDKWAEEHDEEVIIQTGFSTYTPKNATWQKLYGYNQMQQLIRDARIVITHGGPSSFIAPLQYGKIPIVVPRNSEYGEHVNDHQLVFCREVEKRQHNILLVEDTEKLGEIIDRYTSNIEGINGALERNNERFCEELQRIVERII